MRQKRSSKRVEGPPRGGFTLKGSWNDDGAPDSPLTNFVRLMRKERQTSSMTPKEFCERLPATFNPAFPNLDQWQTQETWEDCITSSSAESTIVYAILGRRGEPRTSHESSDPDDPMRQIEYLSHLNEVAGRINKGCAHYGFTHPYDPNRMAMHRLHGELVAKGIYDPDEIIRVIAHELKNRAAQSTLPLTPPTNGG